MLTTSKAWQIIQQDTRFVATNILTGRSLLLARHIGKMLIFCETGKEVEEIEAYLKGYIPSIHIAKTISTAVKKKLLISKEDDIFTDTIPYHHTLWGCSHSISSATKMVIIGAPFGLGNAEDIRCKDFPSHLRNFVWNYYSFRGQEDNIELLNLIGIGPDFNVSNYRKLIRSHFISDIGDIIFYCGETPKMFYTRLEKITKEIIHNRLIPICIGGDHSITFPIVAAFNEKKVPFTVLHFDAHADMKDGAVIKLHDQLGNKLLNHANVIKRILDFEYVTHVYQIGVREPYLYNHEKVTRISINDIKEQRYIKDLTELNMPIYITFDVDFFDPLLAPGTASILPNGGDYNHTFKYLSQILKHKQVIGIDIVEGNSAIDIRNQTTLLVNHLLMHIISQIEI